ncbi:hypothetical protein H5410_059755 [Solanum commersonii]|uniref:Peroxisome biogenesis protein 22 n=1 Tax=Solanum commersonii TaxID=4109 RepID=A0A9J5W3A2_SOLCO|nr:hypothetical protein H5410_059755 [Solanum commersonii]
MADSSKDDFLQLLKRIGAFLTLKISNLSQTLDSRSAGAITGLAFAIVFIWRILRSPSGPQRRHPKQQAVTPGSSGVSRHFSENIPTSEVSPPSEDSNAQNVIDEFFQPVKPTLGQIVRQRLGEGRKVTCRLLGVILEETSPEELQKQATVRSSALEVLLEITKFCDLYLMERVLDDESEKKVLQALEDAGVFTSGGIVKDKLSQPLSSSGTPSITSPHHYTTSRLLDFYLSPRWLHQKQPVDATTNNLPASPTRPFSQPENCITLFLCKVLFCSIENGRTSFVRQLEPDWHIDTNPEIVFQLARFIKYELHITPTKSERTAMNVFSSTSLEQFFGTA